MYFATACFLLCLNRLLHTADTQKQKNREQNAEKQTRPQIVAKRAGDKAAHRRPGGAP